MDSKIDRRKNAEPYKKGEVPSSKSEYFGKSYGQLKRESTKAKSQALKKKMIEMPDGHKVREGSNKHKYWEDIKKRGGKVDSYN